jgi:hypothetical protein
MVLAAARKGQGFAGWLRNYARKPWSIAYIYTNSEGLTAPGYPDFVVFRREGKHIMVDLLEPHHTGSADSLAKGEGALPVCRATRRHVRAHRMDQDRGQPDQTAQREQPKGPREGVGDKRG